MKSKSISSARERTDKASPAPVQTSERPAAGLAVYASWAVVAAAVIFAGIVRVRLLQIPLERDEGEYAYAGQLLLHGIPPYREAFNMKFPGVYAAYALIMAACGQSIAGIHIGLLICNAATIVLVFLLGRRLVGATAGAGAAAAYALLSLSPGVYGTQAHATHFVVLAVLGASLLLLKAMDSGRSLGLFTSGLLFGIGILMKQHGAFFAIFGAGYLVWEGWHAQGKARSLALRKPAILFGGIFASLALAAIALAIAGVFGKFWFWTFTYARQYVTETGIPAGIDTFNAVFPRVVGPNFLIWILAGVGALAIWWKKEDRAAAVFVTALLVVSFVAVCPGLYFREHYFVLMLPAVALLAGAGLGLLQRWLSNPMAIGLYAVVLLFPVFQQSDFFFRLSPLEASRRMYSVNPFPEAIAVAEYIRAHTPENARVVVFGSEPEIYFYAGRRADTGYIYTYSMMEPQPYALTMQNEMIHDIETRRPAYVVVVNVVWSWVVRPDSSRHILQWWDAYHAKNYQKVGVADIISSDQTEYVWSNAESYSPKSSTFLEVYRRKD
jgi:hypothetical protein